MCVGVFDVAFIDLLSNNEQTDKDVKYVAMIIGLVQLVPNLLVQVAVVMVIRVDFSGLAASGFRKLMDPEGVVYSSLVLTVGVMVGRLLLLVVIHTTNRDRE